ncbi:MAG: murein biosynthesis integral membrane protein MurJ [Acidimicrobiales bacterium]
MTRRPRHSSSPRSFTIREHSHVDSLARSAARAEKSAAAREMLPHEVASSVRWAPNDRIVGTGAESEALVAPSGTPAGMPASGTRSPSGLGRVTAIMAGGTLLSRVTGLLRLLVAAYALGYNQLSDAFNLANNTPNIVHDLVLGGILSATFVPLFVDRLARRSEQEANESISAVVSLASIVLVGATVAFVLAAPLIIDLYATGTRTANIGTERVVATELLRMFALQLLGYGAISLMTAILNTVRRFALPAYVPIVNNVIAIAILLEFHMADRHPSVTAITHDAGLLLLLGLGTTAGVIAQAVLLIPSTLRCGLHLRFRWAPRDEAVREVAALSGWTLGFVISNQIALFVTLALAVHVGARSAAVTAYTYAFTFFQLPFGMIAVSVMSAVTPEMSHRWSTHDLEGMARNFGLGLRRMMAGIWPATAGYLVLAGPIMALLLRHGAANNSGGPSLTGSLLALLAAGLPGYCVYLLAIRALQTMRDTRSAFFLYLVENGLNIVLAFVLTGLMGPRGLALSLSIAYSVAALLALFVVRRKMGSLGGTSVGRYVGRSLALALVMAFAVALVAAGIGSSSGSGLYERVIAGVVVGGIVYAGGAALAGTASGWQTSGWRRHAARKGT